jgi:hypothetical protein
MSRSTMTTSEAKELLGCTRQGVQDLYDRGRLSGPPRAAGDRILLWEDSVQAWRARGDSRPRRPAADLDAGTALVAIDVRLARLEAEADARATALAAALAVADELDEAIGAADEATGLVIAALASVQRSKAAQSRASRLRAEAIRQGLMPEPSPPA